MKLLTKASAGIAQWLGRSLGLADSGFWRWYFGSDNYAGKTVTAQTALQLSVVWGCVRLLSQVVGTLPGFLYVRDNNGRRRLATEHPLYTILHDQPNGDMTAADFWQCLIACVALWGNGYALIHRVAGRIVALDPLRPELMVVKLNKAGGREYHYTDLQGKLTKYDESEIFHIKGFSLDGLIGLSPIAYARNTLGIAMAQEETAGRIFSSGLRPSGVVSTDQILTPKNRDEIRKSVLSQVASSSQSGGTVVLEAGMKYQAVTMNPEDAQLLQSRAFSIEELCRWFYNIPPILIGHSQQGQTMWGSGVEQVIMGWRVMGLGPLVVGCGAVGAPPAPGAAGAARPLLEILAGRVDACRFCRARAALCLEGAERPGEPQRTARARRRSAVRRGRNLHGAIQPDSDSRSGPAVG